MAFTQTGVAGLQIEIELWPRLVLGRGHQYPRLLDAVPGGLDIAARFDRLLEIALNGIAIGKRQACFKSRKLVDRRGYRQKLARAKAHADRERLLRFGEILFGGDARRPA